MVAVGLLILVGVIALFALSVTRGRPVNVNLLEYQGGVLYRRGLPLKDVGPGRHRVWVGSEKLIIVDKRPIQVSFENQPVLLQDGSTAIYGISATARVNDTRKVLYCSQNYNQFPAFVILCSSRFVLNGLAVGDLRNVTGEISEAIVQHAKPKLEKAGFELGVLRLTQLSIVRTQLEKPKDSAI